ncbi:unnamed protein product [Caenorhabditis bovis]|uniref:C2H2-type domain-containing protein n=1 Tax=Caenorhabditis bovis TaxID=2654633 RepID=A0A8S1EGX6_9PELO|nr:unnamed protein product [Caenorhabditis bovis]
MDNQQHLPQEIGSVDGEEVVFGQCEQYIEYDSAISLSQERNLLFELYQPEETESGTFLCKICMRTGSEVEFNDRSSFSAHRYKCHGSFNNNIMCPVSNCREVFASLAVMRKHLINQHHLPLEVHQQTFSNIGEFEKFRHLVEASSGCRFMMHTKQPKLKRQVMHCSKSEHKLVIQSNKHKLPRVRMEKEGACCPAHISFRIDAKSGEVHCFSQLYHIGHAPSDPENLTSTEIDMRPIEVHFPERPNFYGDRPIQFLQIDVFDMHSAIYGAAVYEHVLLISDLKTGFVWARALTECSRAIITRVLTAIFAEYGIPEGFSTTYAPTLVRDSMKAIENVFNNEIREIWNEPFSYEDFQHWLLDKADEELGSTNRWVEVLQFVVMEHNQKAEPGTRSSFERMFKRKPPKLYEIDNGDKNEKSKEDDEKAKENEPNSEDEEPTSIPAQYSAGERVFLKRNIQKPGRGNTLPFLYGYIADVDQNFPHFPYKVHYSRNESPWPSEVNIYAWVSPYDVIPTTHKLLELSENDAERRKHYEKLICVCSGESRMKWNMESMGNMEKCPFPCPLYRNELCTNRMSRACCKAEGTLRCHYHEIYPEQEDSYTKLELALVTYNKIMKEQEQQAAMQQGMHDVNFEYEKSDYIEEQPSTSDDPTKKDEMELIEEQESTVVKSQQHQQRVSKKANSQEPQKRFDAETSGNFQKRKRKRSEAVSPTPSVDSSRRQSGRRTIRPKVYDDYTILRILSLIHLAFVVANLFIVDPKYLPPLYAVYSIGIICFFTLLIYSFTRYRLWYFCVTLALQILYIIGAGYFAAISLMGYFTIQMGLLSIVFATNTAVIITDVIIIIVIINIRSEHIEIQQVIPKMRQRSDVESQRPSFVNLKY